MFQQLFCPHCDKVYSANCRKEYSYHLSAKHSIGYHPFCNYCGRCDFMSYTMLKKHKRKCPKRPATDVIKRRPTAAMKIESKLTAAAGSIGDICQSVGQSVVDGVQSVVDGVQSSVDGVQSTSDVMQSAVDVVQSTSDVMQSVVDGVQSTSDVIQSAVDGNQSTVDTHALDIRPTAVYANAQLNQ